MPVLLVMRQQILFKYYTKCISYCQMILQNDTIGMIFENKLK